MIATSQIIVTHQRDAERYILLGWRMVSSQDVVLKGINKKYTECTLIWEEDAPAYPEGPTPDFKPIQV